MLTIGRTERFKRAYKKLTPQEQERAKRAILLLGENPRHPSLQVKKMQGTDGICEARYSRGGRITFGMDGGAVMLRNIGEHDATLNRP